MPSLTGLIPGSEDLHAPIQGGLVRAMALRFVLACQGLTSLYLR